jgi:hypothetical protein
MAVKEQVSAMRRDSTIILVALFALSFTLTLYLGLQSHRAGQELDGIRQTVYQLRQAQAAEQSTANGFLNKLGEYGRTHPEFAQRMAKYQATNAPAATPAPKK